MKTNFDKNNSILNKAFFIDYIWKLRFCSRIMLAS